ncbi:MAG: peptidylprolyl isomerase [Nanoarchaeota archaeon]|nr:peptidylprolyl isomerase [Nanoarchaeota archaeon]
MSVEIGNTVKVTYEGWLDNGEVFDTSKHDDHEHPIEFTVGEHHVIKGFEEGVLGMEIDEEKTISILPKDAYGEHRDELEREFPRNEIPLQNEPKEGMFLSLRTPDGHEFSSKIIKVTPETITLDFNHPLAGKRLNFRIKLVDVAEKESAEAERETEEESEEE